MKTFIVLYRPSGLSILEAPFGFKCKADDADHAEEQCVNAEPDAEVVWVAETLSYREALQRYWHAT